MNQVEELKRENAWLRLAIEKQEGGETLASWIKGQMLYNAGMLDERSRWQRRVVSPNHKGE